MSNLETNSPERGSFPNGNPPSHRRLVLLASVAAIAVVTVAIGLDSGSQTSQFLPQPASAIAAELSAPPALPAPSSGFADLVAKTKPAVVSVQVQDIQPVGATGSDLIPGQPQSNSPGFRFFPFAPPGVTPQRQVLVGEGSGFFVSADGYIVTNNHVVENAQKVQVTTDDGSVYPARVIGTDPKTDMALIKVDANKTFPYVKFASQRPRIGDWVVAIGNPFGLGNTVTAGIVSAIGRDIGTGPYDSFIQVDAPINRGNSGGPTFDLNGNVVGINSVIFTPSGGSVGIGFDIPADTAKTITADLMHSGHVVRGWLGVQIQDVTADVANGLGITKATGALVAQVEAGSPAMHAGLKAGDIITAVNGTPIKDARALSEEIAGLAPGTMVSLDFTRQSGPQTTTLALGTMPEQQQAPPA